MPPLRCACLVARQGTKLLLVRVRQNQHWYLPGGKIEPHESAESALQRELVEELGIELAPPSIRYLYTVVGPAYGQPGDVELVCFSGQWRGEPRARGEISEVQWLDHGDADRLAPAVRLLCARHLRRRPVMKTQRLLFALTALNLVLLAFSVGQMRSAVATEVAPVLRGRALEIVDDSGRIRASITILPADPHVKMPDGTTGYPETVLLRLINSKGRPNVKIQATERGAGQLLGGEADPTHVQILAEGPSTSMRLSNRDGQVQLIRP